MVSPGQCPQCRWPVPQQPAPDFTPGVGVELKQSSPPQKRSGHRIMLARTDLADNPIGWHVLCLCRREDPPKPDQPCEHHKSQKQRPEFREGHIAETSK